MGYIGLVYMRIRTGPNFNEGLVHVNGYWVSTLAAPCKGLSNTGGKRSHTSGVFRPLNDFSEPMAVDIAHQNPRFAALDVAML